ncbi:hypothetical protein QBC37DRAFT_449356 [Rhypophila decipiens]|uniref:Uncharacterized protein n=1 Tax=Rhypophila decipiens TaxID=261697 RepID=A0AAN6Y0Q3_9PEZI|nr:hypothetical protein QBC37DRAFT_449356 [Rhypophila decipiens]
MRQSIIIATLLGAVAWAAPAPAIDGIKGLSERVSSLAFFLAKPGWNYNHDTNEAQIQSDQHGDLVARSNYVECHQNCVRGCPAAWICQAACNAACANAAEADGTPSLAARDA